MSLEGRRRPTLALSLPELWVMLAIALPIVAALVAAMSTVDLAYGVRAGQLMLDQRTILRTDPFTFTVGGQPWLDQQWGAQVILGGLYDLGGWALLAAVRAALVGVVFALVYAACRGAGGSRRQAAGLGLASFVVSAVTLALRPQLLGMALFAVVGWLVAGRRRHPVRLWLVPMLVVAWANVHGSFVLGPALLAWAWLQDRVDRVAGADRTLLVAAVALAATVVNPWGVGIWSYALGVAASPEIRSLVTEWQVTSPLTFAGAAFYLSVAAVVVSLLVRRPPRSAWPSILWLVGLAVVGAYAQRGVAWWAIGAPPVVAAVLLAGRRAGAGTTDPRATAAGRPERRSVANGLIAFAVVAAGVLALPWWRATPPGDGPLPVLTDAPPGVTAALQARAKAGDRLFAPQQLGSWFELSVPATPVFVDSRIELFPTSAWDDYLAVTAAEPGWQVILKRWGVSLVVATEQGEGRLIDALRADPAWRLVYEGDDGLVFSGP